jgi:rare lipoprotein A
MPPLVTVHRIMADQHPQADTLLASHVQSLQLCPIESQAAAVPYAASTVYQVSVKGQPIAEVLTRSEATRLAQTFRRMLQRSSFDPQQIQPARLNGSPAGLADQTPLFVIHEAQAKVYGRSSDLIAINWVNNLREALDAPPLSLHQAQMTMDGLLASPLTLKGTASWYGPYFHRRLTANGERFNQMALTAAHKTLPFNTFLRVTNVKTQQSVVVRINDRGPYVGDRSLDLSWQAARCIGGEDAGLVTYQAEILDEATEEAPPAEPLSLDQPSLVPRVARSLRLWGEQSVD